MSKTPYEFTARLNADGSVAGCHIRYQYAVAGKTVDGDAEPVNLADPVFTSFATAFNVAAVAQSAQLTTDLAAANAAKDAAIQAKQQAETQVATLQARIAELEAELNPPNPFPNADWQGFREAALTDPAIQRVAAGNPVLWPVLFMYLSELSTNPARGRDIAWLWNTMETQTPVSADEIARVNAIAANHGVPLQMNSEGQIVVP